MGFTAGDRVRVTAQNEWNGRIGRVMPIEDGDHRMIKLEPNGEIIRVFEGNLGPVVDVVSSLSPWTDDIQAAAEAICAHAVRHKGAVRWEHLDASAKCDYIEIAAEALSVVSPTVEPTQMGGEGPAVTLDPLVAFLYKLLRDHVHPGDMEQAILEIEAARKVELDLSNHYLAGYAKNIAARLEECH